MYTYVCMYVCMCGIEGQSGKIVCQGGNPTLCLLVWMYVAPPMKMGAWSMAR